MSVSFPRVKLKIIIIRKQWHPPGLPSKNFRIISKDLFLPNTHYLCLSSCTARLFSSFTVVVCVSRELEASVIMYVIHCKTNFSVLMQNATSQLELGRFMNGQLNLWNDIRTILTFQKAFRLLWSSQNWERVESDYLNGSNLILPFLKILFLIQTPSFVSPFKGKTWFDCFLIKQTSGCTEYNLRTLTGIFFYDVLERCTLNSAWPVLAWEEISEPHGEVIAREGIFRANIVFIIYFNFFALQNGRCKLLHEYSVLFMLSDTGSKCIWTPVCLLTHCLVQRIKLLMIYNVFASKIVKYGKFYSFLFATWKPILIAFHRTTYARLAIPAEMDLGVQQGCAKRDVPGSDLCGQRLAAVSTDRATWNAVR